MPMLIHNVKIKAIIPPANAPFALVLGKKHPKKKQTDTRGAEGTEETGCYLSYGSSNLRDQKSNSTSDAAANKDRQLGNECGFGL